MLENYEFATDRCEAQPPFQRLALYSRPSPGGVSGGNSASAQLIT
jgi:hypothetical protein